MKVFIIALNKEAECVLDNLENVTEEIICGKRKICGTLFGEQVVVLVCGVGKVNAACMTQYAIDMLDADCIINIGTAGGLNDKLEIGGIYGIESVTQYDFDLAKINGTTIGVLNEFTDAYLPFTTASGYPLKKLATGDRFNDSCTDYKLLTEVLNADLRDMEGGAIAQTCIHANVPCYCFKVISDIADLQTTSEQYMQNLALCSDNLKRSLRHIMGVINNE